MPDQTDLQAILAARFELETAEPQDRPALERRYHALVDAVLNARACTRYTFLEAIKYVYQDYRSKRLVTERRRKP